MFGQVLTKNMPVHVACVIDKQDLHFTTAVSLAHPIHLSKGFSTTGLSTLVSLTWIIQNFFFYRLVDIDIE